MPLLRGIARTAAIAGTATAVSNRVSRRQAGPLGEARRRRPAGPAASSRPPRRPRGPTPTPSSPSCASWDSCTTSGVLDDAEFELQKSQILNS